MNERDISENAVMQQYMASAAYSNEYGKLKGIYQEPGEAAADLSQYRFTIYEPNGDFHSGEGISYIQTKKGLAYMDCEDGEYVITNPIGYQNGKAVLTDISDILAVQLTNRWKTAANGDSMLSQLFHAHVMNQKTSGLTKEDLMEVVLGDQITINWKSMPNVVAEQPEIYLA